MLVLNIVAVLIIFTITALEFSYQYYDNNGLNTVKSYRFYFTGYYMSLSFVSVCTIIWGYTLIRLYKDVKTSEKLLPNKKLFFLHGSLLSLYLILLLTGILMQRIADNYYEHHEVHKGCVYSVIYIYTVDFADMFLIASFSLVVSMAMPTSTNHQKKLYQYNQFLFGGF